MNELSLFSGAGGGLLASHLLGFRPIGYVEWNDYCQRVIAARIRDGYLPAAPIFGDVRQFVESGAARQYRGFVDVVTGGFPCQPFSTASRGRAVAEDRWPDMLRVIEEVEPPFVQAENVQFEPIAMAAFDLRQLGYSTSIASSCPSGIGSPARRPRWWLVAHANGEGEPRFPLDAEVAGVSDLAGLDWWENDPRPMGMADVLAHRMDRLKALGNGQVPAMAVRAWKELTA